MADNKKPRYRYQLGRRFERLAGPKRQYVDRQTGEVVSRSFVYARSKRVRISQKEIERAEARRRETVHRRRARWFANHHNREVYERRGAQSEYISFDQAEDDDEFVLYESLIHSRDDDLRDLGYAYFQELEDEYENEDWGSP